MIHTEPVSDEHLLFIVGATDKELFEAGIDVGQRTWKVSSLVMQRFGYDAYVMAGPGKPALLGRVEKIMHEIYRPQDFASGGHIGVFMYRDIFAKISVPWIFGSPQFDPLQCVDLTPIQRRIILTEQDCLEAYLDQFSDLADIQYGYMEPRKPFTEMEPLMRFAGLAKLHLHAASAVLTGGYDFRGAVQSALLATELALKAGAAGQNLSAEQIKNQFNHNLTALVTFNRSAWSDFDGDRVDRVVSSQPAYVLNRYSESQPSRMEVGHIVMGAQFVLSEIIRQISDRRTRSGLSPSFTRRYPA